jgi:hypothetical protein
MRQAPAVDVEAVAEALWRRLRDAILAEGRLAAFEFRPETPGAPRLPGLAAVADDPDALDELALDVTLRALGALADRTNFRILSAAGKDAAAPVAGVARAAGLPELAVTERVHALAQVGLAARDLERGAVAVTPAGQGLAGLVEEVAQGVRRRLSQGLPALLGS